MNPTVLVADDDTLALQALVATVKEAGCEVLQANNGEEALHLALQQHPFLIIIDVNMPKKDGIAFVTELRQDQPYGKQAIVILLTQDESTTTLNKALQAGITTYLVKSTLDMNDLKKQIVSLVAAQQK